MFPNPWEGEPVFMLWDIWTLSKYEHIQARSSRQYLEFTVTFSLSACWQHIESCFSKMQMYVSWPTKWVSILISSNKHFQYSLIIILELWYIAFISLHFSCKNSKTCNCLQSLKAFINIIKTIRIPIQKIYVIAFAFTCNVKRFTIVITLFLQRFWTDWLKFFSNFCPTASFRARADRSY